MSERSYPREWSGLLPDESSRWVQQGLISEEQRGAILKLYPSDSAGGRDRTVLVFSILGSVLVGAGVILFFAANWQRIDAWAKVAAILTAVLGAYAAGYHFQYRTPDYPRLGAALIFLANLFHGAAIWLIAQIYHLDTRFPLAFLLWGVGVLPVAWATGSVPGLYLGAVTLGIWTITEQTSFASYNFLFPVLLLAAVLPLARRLRTVLVEAGVLFGLFLWFTMGVMTHLDVAGGPQNEVLLLARLALSFGGAVLAAGMARLGDERAYLGIGGLLSLFGAYLLTFNPGPTIVMLPMWTGTTFQITGLVLLLAAVLGFAGLCYRRAEAGVSRWVVLAGVGAASLLSLGAHAMANEPRLVTFNILLFLATVGMIALGIQRRSQMLVNLGLVAFIIHVLTRYFDLFFSAMDRSLFFIIGGLLLLGGGWLLERNRRRWMQDWGGDSRES